MHDEKLALRLSAVGYLVMAALGIVFAIGARSDAILLSGLFSLISFIMGLLSLRVAELVEIPDDERFHFGYAFFEPFLNTIKGLIILIVCGISVVSAVMALLSGGRVLDPGWGVVYAVIATIGCFAVAVIQRRVASKVASPLVEVDARNWTLDGFVNLGVGAAFLVAFGMGSTRWAHLVPYVDPALLLILVLVLVWIPARTVKDGVAEMLQVAPSPEMQAEVRGRVDRSLAGVDVRTRHVRMVKIGRFFYVLTQLVVGPGFRVNQVKELDDIRRRLATDLEGVHPRLVLDTVFTEDESLIS
jgi:cation diffusion facilitator family transporter